MIDYGEPYQENDATNVQRIQEQPCLSVQVPKMPTQQNVERTSDGQTPIPDDSCIGMKVCFVIVFI